MGPDGTLQMLARGDAAAVRPRLGGMARPDGVVIVSERFWAFARVDGSVQEGEVSGRRGGVARLPLVRGLVRLTAALGPLLGRRGVARRRERRLLIAVLLAPLLAVVAPEPLPLVVGIAATAVLLVWLFRGRTLHLHGAEHRAIAAAEEGRLAATWAGSVRPTRFAERCGTNFAAIALGVTVACNAVWPFPVAFFTPALVSAVSLALSMELWQLIQGTRRRVLRPLLLPGLALQRLTTREPRLDETRVALAAVASVLARELDAP